MRRLAIGTALLTGFAATALLAGVGDVQASKPFKPVTRMACDRCHTSKNEADMTARDLSDGGKKAQAVLRAAGLTHELKDEGEAKQWASKLRGFKP